jgi:hypothetical protein
MPAFAFVRAGRNMGRMGRGCGGVVAQRGMGCSRGCEWDTVLVIRMPLALTAQCSGRKHDEGCSAPARPSAIFLPLDCLFRTQAIPINTTPCPIQRTPRAVA